MNQAPEKIVEKTNERLVWPAFAALPQKKRAQKTGHKNLGPGD
ncbi:hypothetical protein [Variovorax sp. KK3]|nr:hypothetical protein [Variovorax sp. KK3]